MIQFLNQHHKKFLTVIFAVVAVSFSFFGPGTCSKQAPDSVTLDGKVFGVEAKTEAATILAIAQRIGFHSPNGRNDYMAMMNAKSPAKDLAMLLSSAGSSKRKDRGDSGQEQLATLVTLRKQAKALGISIPQSEIDKEVQNSSFFQKDGKFSREEYDAFFAKATNKTLVEKQLFTMYRDALTVDRMAKLIAPKLEASDFEVESAYNRQNAILTAQVIALPRKDHESIKAEEKDAKEFYDNQKTKKPEEQDASVVTPASRNIRYVMLSLADRTEDITKLDAAAQEAKKKDWDAKDANTRSVSSELFDLAAESVDESTNSPDMKGLEHGVNELKKTYGDKLLPIEIKTFANLHRDNMPDEIKNEPQASTALLRSYSKIGTTKMAKGYVIYEIVKENPITLLDYEQVKDKLITKLTDDKISAALTEKFNTVRNALETALNAKKTWAEALVEAKVTATELVINPQKPNPQAPEYQQAVVQALESMKSNTLAKNAVDSGADKLLVFLAKRELMDSPKMTDDIRQMKDSLAVKSSPFGGNPLFDAWFETKREEVYPLFANAE